MPSWHDQGNLGFTPDVMSKRKMLTHKNNETAAAG
jgi:hypothetical protein